MAAAVACSLMRRHTSWHMGLGTVDDSNTTFFLWIPQTGSSTVKAVVRGREARLSMARRISATWAPTAFRDDDRRAAALWEETAAPKVVVATCRDPVQRFASAVGTLVARGKLRDDAHAVTEAISRTLRNPYWNEHVVPQSHFFSCFENVEFIHVSSLSARLRNSSVVDRLEGNKTYAVAPSDRCLLERVYKLDYELVACFPGFKQQCGQTRQRAERTGRCHRCGHAY